MTARAPRSARFQATSFKGVEVEVPEAYIGPSADAAGPYPPTANKTVVGKTATITSKADDSHSFKVELTEKKASVATLTTAAKEMEEVAEQKSKKKKRSKSRKSISTASNSSDEF
ncbi:hypothetical protein PF005_g10735 [Phytophthora fragariae]|uniref:Uncharacterized protein n=1 Tax=Phytophthora fragariae TaxID=53985 RepID=A0A6A3Y4M5_9STRA|nr:hypothetical protein PF009_g20199 [Phytophthora fragariae]KAE9107165.1 hypothetical protein PF007_g13133 [Phytophthora fragariae]KAE9133606.1 hypothetical protein PF006_g15004 [Phytophthora fragariae]KAE9203355.1 hypothetical protein PF004_g18158 [Phytophthora fragariae]KAE9212113.1 hypothetical protein PF005_g10735 [Phytophthora fragariae]